MKTIDLTKEIPELSELVNLTNHVDHLEFVLDAVKTARSKIAFIAFQKLIKWEEQNNAWIGDKALFTYKGLHYLVEVREKPGKDPLKVTEVSSEFLAGR